MFFYVEIIWCKHYFNVGTVHTQKLVLVLNPDSDDLHRSWFYSKIGNQENSAYTEVSCSLKWGLTKIVLTPKFCLYKRQKKCTVPPYVLLKYKLNLLVHLSTKHFSSIFATFQCWALYESTETFNCCNFLLGLRQKKISLSQEKCLHAIP